MSAYFSFENLLRLSGMGIFTFFLAWWLTGPLLVARADFGSLCGRNPFYGKLGKQLGLLNICMNIVFLALLAYWAYSLPIQHGHISFVASLAASLFFPLFPDPSSPPAYFGYLPFVCLASGLFSLLYLFSRALLKKLKFVHLLTAVAAWLCGLGILLAGAALLRVQLAELSWATPRQSMLYPFLYLLYLVGCMLANCLASGGILASMWLVMRRKREDYGRDYYRFALAKSSGWAACFGLLGLALNLAFAAAIYLNLLPIAGDTLGQPIRAIWWLEAAWGLCSLAATLLCLRINRSQNPLRHKVSLFMSAVFVFLSAALLPLAFERAIHLAMW